MQMTIIKRVCATFHVSYLPVLALKTYMHMLQLQHMDLCNHPLSHKFCFVSSDFSERHSLATNSISSAKDIVLPFLLAVNQTCNPELMDYMQLHI